MSINLAALRNTPTESDPYPHLVVPGFLSLETVDAVIRDYPKLDMPGLFMPDAAPSGPAFAQLLQELESPELRRVVGEKLGVDLEGCPTLVTVRSCCQAKDGRIHADAHFKRATLLLYLNESWAPQGGRLRILRSGKDIEDYQSEVPPEGGLLVCFKVQPDSWHGHKPFAGPRRYVMVNYCQSRELRDREAARHRMTGQLKKVSRLFGIGRIDAA